ncbi:MAG TPA: hypothetical protein VF516_36740 [Kofleriaceae bacterium]
MLVAVIGMLAASAVAHAGTRRIAVVVGPNTGNDDRTPLHFAELDAGKFARVLGELGGGEPADLAGQPGLDLAARGERDRDGAR